MLPFYVIGAGRIGLPTAHFLLRANKDVICVDLPDRIKHLLSNEPDLVAEEENLQPLYSTEITPKKGTIQLITEQEFFIKIQNRPISEKYTACYICLPTIFENENETNEPILQYLLKISVTPQIFPYIVIVSSIGPTLYKRMRELLPSEFFEKIIFSPERVNPLEIME